MILIDTSAWIEFLRDTASPVADRVGAALDQAIAVCDPVRMEVLAGARDESHLSDMRRLLARASTIPIGPADYEEAAVLYRMCRRKGDTVRKVIDCLIATAAIKSSAAVLHLDADFDILARHTPLRTVEL
ncbi:MAG: PIN domain nuclease [Actinomycetota bacterium]